MRGRKPKPTHLRVLEGNPGNRPINEKEPEMPAADDAFDAPPPELLDNPIASAEWSRVAPMLRKAKAITQAERSALITLCQQWAIYVEAHNKVRSTSLVIMAPSGYPIVNPYLGISNKAMTNCVKLWAELGLTPSARSRVMTPGDEGGDGFAEFD